MKPLVILLFLIFCVHTLSFGQAEIAGTNTNKIFVPDFSGYQFQYYGSIHDGKGLIIGGIVTMSAGLVTTGAGYTYILLQLFGLANSNDHTIKAGIITMGVGAGIVIVGGVLLGVGVHEKRNHYALQLIAPKNNEIGLAYNF